MLYLISTYWLWMLAALILGAAVGWLIYDRALGWSRPAALIFVAGLVLALLKVLPGSAGLWLETALLLFASYVIGGLIGAFARRQTMGEPLVAGKSMAVAATAGSLTSAAALSPAKVSGSLPGKRPAGAALAGAPDDLKLIKGIGPKNENILNGLGTHKFQQIAGWTGDECKWVGHHMAFPGRVEREHWVDQAKLLASGGDTDHSRAIKSGAIKADAGGDAPLGEADIARLKQDVIARAAAAKAAADAAAGEIAAKAAAAKAAAEAATREAAVKAAADTAAKESAAKAAAEAATREAAVKAAADTAAKESAAKAAAEAATREAAAKAAVDTAAKESAAKAAADAAAREAEGREAQASAARVSAAKAAADKDAAAKASHPGQRPPALEHAKGGSGDDLKLIKGVGPKNESILHSLGIWHFDQISDWNAGEAAWVGHHMAFPGRVEREHWIEQARLLGAGLETEHSAGVKSGAIKVDASADAALSDAEAGALKAALPQTAPAVADEGKFEGKRPLGLAQPRGGSADDLKRIRGIGPQNEGRLHGLGIWHFDQIANWTAAQVQWVGGYLAFPGRIDRETWIAQAKLLALGQETEFSKRVDKGLVATSRDDGSKGLGNVGVLPGDGSVKH